MKKQIEYFVRGYTGLGEVNYIESNIKEIKDVYILKAANEKTATLFLKQFINILDDKYTVEVIKNPDYAEALDGVIVRNKSLAILTTPFIKYVSSHSHLIDLTKYTKLPIKFIAKKRKEIIESTIDYFSKSLECHKEIEKIHKKDMNFEIADQLKNDFIEEKIQSYPNLDKQAHTYIRMFGTNTSEGIVSCVDNLLEPIENHVFLKGAPGTGKSHFMKQVSEEVIKKGYDVEVYKCSFDTRSIDMIIIREMGYCLFDSSSPHDYDPSQRNDYMINLLEVASKKDYAKQNESTIKELKANHDRSFNNGLIELAKLQELAGSIENSEIKLTNDEVKSILADYTVNY
ncbi:MAG TPA: hypothetical protein VK121_09390 [Pseudogracilibacillus sp.]|nr:hypothetical protein [Pseudogracilibacillus sp.]